ncbi:MAG: DUF922 domain-containing protein [Sphingomicrobium sp.]
MLGMIVALAAVTQASPATPAAGARRLKDLPNVTITYYDVAGKNGKAIEKNLRSVRTDRATKQFSAVSSNWNVAASVNRITTNGVCTIKSVKSTFSGTVQLPRLTEESLVPADVLTNWRSYADGLDRSVADNFFFVYDQLPALEQSLIGKDCAEADKLWASSVARIKADAIQHSQAAAAADAAKAAAAAAAAKKNGGGATPTSETPKTGTSGY